MLDKPQLVGERRSATDAIGRELRIFAKRMAGGNCIGYRRSWRVWRQRGEQERLDIHSLCEHNALRHTRQYKLKYS